MSAMHEREPVAESLEPKRCITCDYSLHGLSESRCPECGRGFDPSDPETYRIGPRRSRLPAVLLCLSIVSPWVYVGLEYFCWLIGAIELGHFPRVTLDDPTQIGPLTSVCHFVTMMMMIPLMLVAPFAGVISLIPYFYRAHPNLRGINLLAFVAASVTAGITSLFYAVWFLRGSYVSNWFMD